MPIDMEREEFVLSDLLAKRGLDVFRVTRRGKSLTIVSGPADDPDPHARMTNTGPRHWRLDLRHHSGRWEPTPFGGELNELLDTLVSIGRLDPNDA